MSTIDKYVPRGTLEPLEKYVDLVLKWNKSVNLISRSTEKDMWDRHILDCAQLISFISKSAVVLDIGSGAGFPGLVISIIQGNKVFLVEKDSKKCAFLHQAKALTNANVEIINAAIEKTKAINIDIITSRALASVGDILNLTYRFVTSETRLVLLKGMSYEEELKKAMSDGWSFEVGIKESVTNESSAVLVFSEVVKNG